MGDDWRRIDKETDYPELMARKVGIPTSKGDRGHCAPVSFVSAYFAMQAKLASVPQPAADRVAPGRSPTVEQLLI
jgi:hypothetical protein